MGENAVVEEAKIAIPLSDHNELLRLAEEAKKLREENKNLKEALLKLALKL